MTVPERRPDRPAAVHLCVGHVAPSCLRRRSSRSVRVRSCCSAGFLWFISRVPNEEIRLTGDADGIVALTGGASRVTDAMELMAAGRGKRLLISGLNRTTTVGEILRRNPDFARVVRCCVDYDRSLNTLGNAIETKRWAEGRGFRSLIVVTSNYHMPRALAEIAHQMPNVVLVPFPVVTDRQRAEPWWKTAAAAPIDDFRVREYVYAKVRMGTPSRCPAGRTGCAGWPYAQQVRCGM